MSDENELETREECCGNCEDCKCESTKDMSKTEELKETEDKEVELEDKDEDEEDDEDVSNTISEVMDDISKITMDSTEYEESDGEDLKKLNEQIEEEVKKYSYKNNRNLIRYEIVEGCIEPIPAITDYDIRIVNEMSDQMVSQSAEELRSNAVAYANDYHNALADKAKNPDTTIYDDESIESLRQLMESALEVMGNIQLIVYHQLKDLFANDDIGKFMNLYTINTFNIYALHNEYKRAYPYKSTALANEHYREFIKNENNKKDIAKRGILAQLLKDVYDAPFLAKDGLFFGLNISESDIRNIKTFIQNIRSKDILKSLFIFTNTPKIIYHLINDLKNNNGSELVEQFDKAKQFKKMYDENKSFFDSYIDSFEKLIKEFIDEIKTNDKLKDTIDYAEKNITHKANIERNRLSKLITLKEKDENGVKTFVPSMHITNFKQMTNYVKYVVYNNNKDIITAMKTIILNPDRDNFDATYTLKDGIVNLCGFKLLQTLLDAGSFMERRQFITSDSLSQEYINILFAELNRSIILMREVESNEDIKEYTAKNHKNYMYKSNNYYVDNIDLQTARFTTSDYIFKFICNNLYSIIKYFKSKDFVVPTDPIKTKKVKPKTDKKISNTKQKPKLMSARKRLKVKSKGAK